MDAKIRQLLREFQRTQDPVIAMQIASALCRVEDTTTELLAVGVVDDEGSGTIVTSTQVDISPEAEVANNRFDAQIACNKLHETNGNIVPGQILIVGYGEDSPEVVYHWELDRHYRAPGITAMRFVLNSLEVETSDGRDTDGELLLYTLLRAGGKKAAIAIPIFERVFPEVTILVDHDQRIFIHTGINPDEGDLDDLEDDDLLHD